MKLILTLIGAITLAGCVTPTIVDSPETMLAKDRAKQEADWNAMTPQQQAARKQEIAQLVFEVRCQKDPSLPDCVEAQREAAVSVIQEAIVRAKHEMETNQ